jgi:hypothetical protein
MTIVASVKVRDGLTLATDSMSHITATSPEGQPQFVTYYENARKLFQVAELPVGVMTYGLGNLGQRSIEGIMLDFNKTGPGAEVSLVARQLFDFVKGRYDELFAEVPVDHQPALGFFVAGYSPGEAFPEEHEFLLPRDDEATPVRDQELFGAGWRGVDGPFVRLLKGADPLIGYRLAEKGANEDQLNELLGDLEMPVIFDGMPVQDAINFAVYILKTTIGYTEFSVGVPPCGGPLQIATILPDDGFRWIAKPELRAP